MMLSYTILTQGGGAISEEPVILEGVAISVRRIPRVLVSQDRLTNRYKILRNKCTGTEMKGQD